MDGPHADAYRAASEFFVQAIELVKTTAWESPGIGDWTLLELAGHANRAHTTVEDYLLRPQPPEPKDSKYFSEAAIAERGRDSVAALGGDPTHAIKSVADRVLRLVSATPGDATISGPVGVMTLETYLPSRTAELTIHTIDVLQAIGVHREAPADALRESLSFVTNRSLRSENGEIVLRALSGRAQLPIDFSVY